MTVAVTGATGHVGANLVRTLLARGDRVRCLVHTDSAALEGLDVERVQGDVLDPASLVPLVEGAELVIHCAAVISITGDPDGQVQRVNVQGVHNIATAARNADVRRFVHLSSCHAFDLRADRVDENSPRPGPEHPAYDRSKADGEDALRAVEGLDHVILNPAGIIGPWDFAPSRMGTAFLQVRDRTLPGLIDGGFYFIDVRDVVDAVLAAAERGESGANYLLGGHYCRIDELMRFAAEICGSTPPRFSSPMWLARIGAPFMTLWSNLTGAEPLYTAEGLFALRSPRDNFDQSRAISQLGFQPRPLEETVQSVYESFRHLEI